ncbi:MAG: KpsF/GutQ family sugar-phosphate isomerase [Nitrospirales bacterium]
MEILEELRRVIRLEAQAILHLEDCLGPPFEEAVSMLQACKGKVIVTGVGKSGLIANKISATMVSTGTPAVFLHGSEAMHGDIGIVRKDDIVLAVGRSGESEELLTLLPFIKKIGARILSITSQPESTLAKNSDLVLLTPIQEEACPLNMAPTCSTTVALVLGDALAMALMKLRNFQPADFALFHPGGQLGKRLLLTVGDLMRMGEANPLIHLSQNVQMVLCEMTSKRAGAVSVIDEEGRLLGLITDFDIRRVLESGEALFSLTIEDVMNPKPSWVYQDEKAVNALEFMEKREKPISVLPVLDRQEKVVGILHLHDLVSCGI